MNEFASFLGGLPVELQAFIALAVLAGVRALLAGRVPEQFVTELAAVISTALIAIIELALGLIPSEFDSIVAAILQLIVVLLGAVTVARLYVVVWASMFDRKGVRF